MINRNSNMIQELTLLNLSRSLVDELRYINYPLEWSKPPLADLLIDICSLLDTHARVLGSIISNAFNMSLPKFEYGNINQLNVLYPKLFEKNRQYYMDLADVIEFAHSQKIFDVDLYDKKEIATNPIAVRCEQLAKNIVNVFVSMSPDQENEHRSLERICFSTSYVCYAYGIIGVGFDLSEYADQWRNLTASERMKLGSEIISRWSQL